MKTTVYEVCEYLKTNAFDCIYRISDENKIITGASALLNYKENTISWLKNNENRHSFLQSGGDFSYISLLITQEGVEVDASNVIYAPDSKRVFFSLVDNLINPIEKKAEIGKFTYISQDVLIGKNVQIGSNCSIHGDIVIGDGCIIGDNVVIQGRVSIGVNTVIQPGCVIGIDGFGLYEDVNNKRKTMVRHHGGVKIGFNVFIGSHTNIARGTLDDTIIGDGVKIAPSTHIGHNDYIGNDSVVICSNLYGSVTLGDNTYVTACTIENQRKIGDNSLVGMGAVVTKDIPEGQIVVGIPARYLRDRY